MKPRSATVASRAVALLVLPLALGSVAWADNGSPLVDAVEAKNREAVVALLDLSPLASAWTRDAADAFWTAHRERIDDVVKRRGARPAEDAA